MVIDFVAQFIAMATYVMALPLVCMVALLLFCFATYFVLSVIVKIANFAIDIFER